MKPYLIMLLAATIVLINGCASTAIKSTAPSSSTASSKKTEPTVSKEKIENELDTDGPPQVNPAPKWKPSDPKGVIMVSPRTAITYLSCTGLTIQTDPPKEDPAKTAWQFFKLQGEQKYDEALLTIHGHQHHDTILYGGLTGKKGTPYLKEVLHSQLVRWADITDLAPKETEDMNTYQYKVIYMEVNIKLRGTLTKKETDMRNGLNRFAVHLVQEKQEGPWEISLLAGAPWMMTQ